MLREAPNTDFPVAWDASQGRCDSARAAGNGWTSSRRRLEKAALNVTVCGSSAGFELLGVRKRGSFDRKPVGAADPEREARIGSIVIRYPIHGTSAGGDDRRGCAGVERWCRWIEKRWESSSVWSGPDGLVVETRTRRPLTWRRGCLSLIDKKARHDPCAQTQPDHPRSICTDPPMKSRREFHPDLDECELEDRPLMALGPGLIPSPFLQLSSDDEPDYRPLYEHRWEHGGGRWGHSRPHLHLHPDRDQLQCFGELLRHHRRWRWRDRLDLWPQSLLIRRAGRWRRWWRWRRWQQREFEFRRERGRDLERRRLRRQLQFGLQLRPRQPE